MRRSRLEKEGINFGDEDCHHMMIRRLTKSELKDKESGALKPVFVCETCDALLFVYAPPNNKVARLSDS